MYQKSISSMHFIIEKCRRDLTSRLVGVVTDSVSLRARLSNQRGHAMYNFPTTRAIVAHTFYKSHDTRVSRVSNLRARPNLRRKVARNSLGIVTKRQMPVRLIIFKFSPRAYTHTRTHTHGLYAVALYLYDKSWWPIISEIYQRAIAKIIKGRFATDS